MRTQSFISAGLTPCVGQGMTGLVAALPKRTWEAWGRLSLPLSLSVANSGSSETASDCINRSTDGRSREWFPFTQHSLDHSRHSGSSLDSPSTWKLLLNLYDSIGGPTGWLGVEAWDLWGEAEALGFVQPTEENSNFPVPRRLLRR